MPQTGRPGCSSIATSAYESDSECGKRGFSSASEGKDGAVGWCDELAVAPLPAHGVLEAEAPAVCGVVVVARSGRAGKWLARPKLNVLGISSACPRVCFSKR